LTKEKEDDRVPFFGEETEKKETPNAVVVSPARLYRQSNDQIKTKNEKSKHLGGDRRRN